MAESEPYYRCVVCKEQLGPKQIHTCAVRARTCSHCNTAHRNGDAHACTRIVLHASSFGGDAAYDAPRDRERDRDVPAARPIKTPTTGSFERVYFECGNGCLTNGTPYVLVEDRIHMCTKDLALRLCEICKTRHYNGSEHRCELVQLVVVPDPRAVASDVRSLAL